MNSPHPNAAGAAAAATVSVPLPVRTEVPTLQRIGFYLLVIFLFIIFSRIFDVKFWYLHIPGISFRFIQVLIIVSGCFVKPFKSRIGVYMLLFTAWFVMCIPGSEWRSGSFDLFRGAWLMAFTIYVAAAGLPSTYDHTVKAVRTVAYATFVLAMLALLFGSSESGRLFLPQGRFANPNEMAQALLVGLPLWAAIVLNAPDLLRKVMVLPFILILCVTVAKTGSRGAMVAIVVMGALLFMQTSLMGKVKMLCGALAVLVLAAAFLPSSLKSRYRNLSEEEEEGADSELTQSAAASTKSRKELLKKSISLTFRHPLFGVGPGMFAVAEDREAKAAGLRRGSWLGTHNSYTQVSSEMGFPALFLYVGCVVLGLKYSRALYRRTRSDPRLRGVANMAGGLYFSIISLSVTAFFAHMAYSSMFPVLLGLTVSFCRTANEEIARIEAQGPAPASPGVPWAVPAMPRVPAAAPLR